MEQAQDRSESLARLREQLAPVLGENAAKRIKAHTDGSLYVDSTAGAAFLAWFIDLVLVDGTAFSLGALYYTRSYDPKPWIGASVITLVLLVVLPFLYGWFYRNGRALGAVLTSTRLVRIKDGSRIGWAKAGWAMLIRTFFLPFFFWAALDGDNSSMQERMSIDNHATKKLRAAGYWRL